jgi:GTP cyclohydrolase I
MMLNNNLIEMMKRLVGEYVPHAKENIIRNNHMNDYKNEEFPKESTAKILEIFTIPDNFADLKETPSRIDLLNKMTEITKDNFKELKIEKVSQDTTDAILIDFINYVGMFQGVDYAIYTKDLYVERTPI